MQYMANDMSCKMTPSMIVWCHWQLEICSSYCTESQASGLHQFTTIGLTLEKKICIT